MRVSSGRLAVAVGGFCVVVGSGRRTTANRATGWATIAAGLMVVVLAAATPVPAHAALPCDGCHRMPPLDSADGSRDPNTGAVAGNHQGHNPTPAVAADCVKCHGAGVLTYVSGHMDFTVQLVTNVNDSSPAASYLVGGVPVASQPYTNAPIMGTCTNVNCHFRKPTALWGTHTAAGPAKCGSCHAFPPADGSHVAHGNVLGAGSEACAYCHAAYTDGSHALATGTRGLIVAFTRSPNSGGTYSGDVSYPTYMDSTSRSGTCSVYCHSDGKGDLRAPTWGGASQGCKGCHGNDAAPAFASTAGEPNYANEGPGLPFANSHLGHVTMAGVSCASCHTGSSHVDGVIDIGPGDGASFTFTPPMTCSNVSCHGLQTPAATWGGAFALVTPVGAAHPQHGQATPERTAGLPCAECHECPGPEPVFGPLAYTKNVTPTYDAASRACTNYCHGAAMKAPPATAAVWSNAAPTYSCTGCHGAPPPAPHPQMTACSACHGRLGAAHINGTTDFTIDPTLGCAGCHGYPPATGAHVTHFGLADAATSGQYGETLALQDRYPGAYPTSAPAVYAFGCGNCHPVDTSRHFDGSVDVEMHEAGAPPSSLKARSPATAAYDQATGACSNVYCHSSGQELPVFVTTPGWTSGHKLSCTGCHANPPQYASGGAGTSDANTHVVVADDGWQLGHFLGLPGPWHGSKHGAAWGPGDDAAPMTCQTCHYDTTDPSNTAPGGFYYLDTSGGYRPAGVDPSSTIPGCTDCHAANTAAPVGAGKVLPLRHVNGARDVVFDPRTTLPDMPWLPAGAARPTKPYWATAWNTQVPAGAVSSGGTVSFDLAGASYDGTSKTCSNVACHLNQTQVQWGATPVGWASCDACHQYGY